jgi:hypothetical protein
MSTQTGLRDAKGYDGQLSNTLVAIFATSHDAHAAIKELHKAGFRQTWLGVMNEIDRDTARRSSTRVASLAFFRPIAYRSRRHC